jgi:hypothetical protein
MSEEWLDFHTLYEALAAINVALYAVPELRRQSWLDHETANWEKLMKGACPSHPRLPDAHEAYNAFEEARIEIETKKESIRSYCAWMALLA